MIFTHVCEISFVDLGISLLSECCAMFMASKAEPDCHWVWWWKSSPLLWSRQEPQVTIHVPHCTSEHEICTTLYFRAWYMYHIVLQSMKHVPHCTSEHDTCNTLFFRAWYMYPIVSQSMIHVPHCYSEHDTCTSLYLRAWYMYHIVHQSMIHVPHTN